MIMLSVPDVPFFTNNISKYKTVQSAVVNIPKSSS